MAASTQYKVMLHEPNRFCLHLDAVGLNSYADMLTLPEDIPDIIGTEIVQDSEVM